MTNNFILNYIENKRFSLEELESDLTDSPNATPSKLDLLISGVGLSIIGGILIYLAIPFKIFTVGLILGGALMWASAALLFILLFNIGAETKSGDSSERREFNFV